MERVERGKLRGKKPMSGEGKGIGRNTDVDS